ncbi:MAG: lasso peptide biosynthesis protein [Gammaproteobacteria bacterium]|nr:lasso peptide biosynthesis protein [Gammaproteobacteria bacterium]
MESTATTQLWSSIHVSEDLNLLYGPRLGRFYLLPYARALDPGFVRIAGLHQARFCDALPDPAEQIGRTLEGSPTAPMAAAALIHVLAYRLLHVSRHVMPLRLMATLLRRISRLRRGSLPQYATHAALAEALYTLEFSMGSGDCYPRALMTAYFALKSGQACTITVGALTPTRKMHVWCVVDGVLPFEPLPEHYLYQPLWTLRLMP